MSERTFDGGGGGGGGYCLFAGLEKSMLGMSNNTTSLRAAAAAAAAADPSHVAQQSRRDKLRVQHMSTNQATPSTSTTLINQDAHHLHDHHHQSREGLQLNHDDVNSVHLMYSSSDMLSFASGTHFQLGGHHLAGGRPESSGGGASYWGSGSNNNNYLGGNVVLCNNELIGSTSSPNLDLVNGGGGGVVMSNCSLKPGQGGYNQEHVVQSSLNNIINPVVVVPTELSNQTAAAAPPEHAHKLQMRENLMRCNFVTSSPSFYQDHHLVTSTSSPTINAPSSHGFHNMLPMASRPESGHGSSWNNAGVGAAGGNNELVLLPTFAPGQWSSCRNMEMNNNSCTSTGTDNASQRLSLSLSSHQPSESGAGGGSGRGVLAGAKFFGNSIQSVVSTSSNGGTSSSLDLRRAAGPLGPFTGYATILKSSRFLKPARQLLDELCCFSASTSPKLVKASSTTSLHHHHHHQIMLPHERENSGEPSTSSDVFNVDRDPAAGGLSGNSGGSASTPNFYGSTESGSDLYNQGIRPEFQRRKAKLLSMQEEVGKRYKQYHQQMQMVMSSFESVAGLTAATPYISFALKSVTKHFRSLKQAISEQIRTVSKALGEELMSIASTKDDVAMQKLRFFEHSFRKHKAGDNLAFLEHQQPVWRPQRGLPERAVAVLRAWLFEHFLHPYPTDTDKHMLAAQTGLSRNQVSNWFINARVRVWKPMVEEIHMLETKGSAEVDLNSVKIDGKTAATATRKVGGPCILPSEATSTELSQKASNCSNAVTLNDPHGKNDLDQWHPADKRSKMEECQISRALDGGMMGFMPYPSGMEMLGAGSVSLTLGLRHSAENMQQKHLQQQQQQQHHMMLQQHQREQQLRQLGGHHLAHDFTG